MERDLNDDEFEIFLKQKVDQHKLYPSDKAWKGIYNSLHPGMRWFKIGGTLLVFSTLFIVYQNSFVNNSPDSISGKSLTKNLATLRISSAQRNRDLKATNADNIDKALSPTTELSESTTASTTHITPAVETAINSTNKIITGALENNVSTNAEPVVKTNITLPASNNLKGFLLHGNNSVSMTMPVNVAIPVNKTRQSRQDEQNDPAIDDLITRSIKSSVIGDPLSNDKEVSVKDLNWLQEMAAIKLTPRKKDRFNLQFYFSPTVSYRRLADNQNVSHSTMLGAPSVSGDLNINRYVDHNPAIGAELGSNILFSVNRNFTLKSGLQLNYSRYNIKAFNSSSEKAFIALKTAGRIPDTLSSYTTIRNFNGSSPDELQNQYLQLSVPVGAELKLMGNKRLQFSIAGTIQPTFLLFSDTYLLSTNYINYVKEPSLVRKWNVHSSFEAFLSYKTGGLRWQLGPQFRYQLMSSFNDRYPIKEYLMEYGVKIGVSKTLR